MTKLQLEAYLPMHTLYHLYAHLELQFPVILYSCKTNAAKIWKRIIMGVKCSSQYRLWQKKPSKPLFCFTSVYLQMSMKYIILCENLKWTWKCFMVIKIPPYLILAPGKEYFLLNGSSLGTLEGLLSQNDLYLDPVKAGRGDLTKVVYNFGYWVRQGTTLLACCPFERYTEHSLLSS